MVEEVGRLQNGRLILSVAFNNGINNVSGCPNVDSEILQDVNAGA